MNLAISTPKFVSDVTTDDIKAELIGIGIQNSNIEVRVLQHKDDWKSFIATIPKVHEQQVKYIALAHGPTTLLFGPFDPTQLNVARKSR